MSWTVHDVPGGDWRPGDQNARAHYADRLHRINMAGHKPVPGHPAVEETRISEMTDITQKLGRHVNLGSSTRLSDGYLPLLELVIDGLQLIIPEQESLHQRHDLYRLAEVTHRRIQGRIFHPDGWYRRGGWLPQDHESNQAHHTALRDLVIAHRI